MANYVDNDLTIKGDSESMKEFFDSIGSNLYSFSMEKFLPIPTELKQTSSPEGFYPEKTKTIYLKNGNQMDVKADRFNQTFTEYMEKRNFLSETYGYTNWDDWRCANWGCDQDMMIGKIISTNDELFNMFYITRWNPNINFIKFLARRFPKLIFELEYYEPLEDFAGIYRSEKGVEEIIEQKLSIFYFVKTEEVDKYKFIGTDQDYNNNYDAYFPDYDCIYIVGNKWEKALTRYLFNENNVVNWNEVVRFINTKY